MFNPLTSPGEGVTVSTSPYLSAGAPAQGETKGLIPDFVSDFNKDLFSSMTFIDWTYSYEFVTMVGSSGKYGEYNSFNLDILSVIYKFPFLSRNEKILILLIII